MLFEAMDTFFDIALLPVILIKSKIIFGKEWNCDKECAIIYLF